MSAPAAESSPPLKIMYFNIRGRGGCLRLIASEAGVAWENEVRAAGGAVPGRRAPQPCAQIVDRPGFGALRAAAPAGPLTYMQLPCIVDGDFSLVQRVACAQYIASKVRARPCTVRCATCSPRLPAALLARAGPGMAGAR